MIEALLPRDEAARLHTLRELQVLDTAAEAEFDALVNVAAAICGVPISLVSLVDAERQWFKAQVGLPGTRETPRALAFCAHAIHGDGIFEVPDATADPRFADNPLVTGAPDIRFYAGAPLKMSDGTQAGTLCVIDRQPRVLNAAQRTALAQLGTAAARALEGRRALLAERQLHAEALRASAILSNSVDAIAALDRDGKVTHWNPAAERLFGYSSAQMLGRSLEPLFRPQDWRAQARLEDTFANAAHGITFDAVRLHRNGQPILVSISLAPIRGAGGTIEGATKIVRDRREQARAVAVLAASEARFKALSASSPYGVFATDAEGVCTYTNERWQTIFGLTLQQSLGEAWTQVVHPDDRASVHAVWQRAAAQGVEFDMQFRILRSDGQTRMVQARARGNAPDQGQVVGYVGSVEDITTRLRIQRSLNDERARLAFIIEGTGAGTWEWNVQTGETRFNERWAQIVGATLAELAPTTIQTWADLTHPEDMERSTRLLEAHFAGATGEYECEARMRHRDGHWVWVLDRGRVLTRTPDGRPEWMFGTHMEITARKAQEEQLRKSEELLKQTGALAQVGGWELDITSGRIYWSEQTCRIHGVESGYQPQLAEAIDFYAHEARPVVEAAVAKAMADGQGWDLELPFIQQGGRRIWVRTVGHAVFEGKQPVKLVGAFQDITHTVLSRHTLEATHERMLLATESGEIGVWELDLHSGVLSWDARMYALYGMPDRPGADAYEFWARHLHPDDRVRAEHDLQVALDTGADLRSEFRVVWVDGSVHSLRAAGRMKRDSLGNHLRMVGVNWDVTPLRRGEEELHRSNADLEQFAYVASHDLQEPLRMVANYCELLAQRYQGQLDDKADKYIHYAVDGARRMQRLVADLLAYARVGSQAAAFEPVHVGTVLDDVRRALRVAIAEASATIEVNTLPQVLGDAAQLRQLFQNLISNAIKFRGTEPPRISIHAKEALGRWHFEISDNGIGIDMQYAERIFQMFQRLHAVGTYEGSGIGLAIAKRIVERHGGRMILSSRPGAGSTFGFSLPDIAANAF